MQGPKKFMPFRDADLCLGASFVLDIVGFCSSLTVRLCMPECFSRVDCCVVHVLDNNDFQVLLESSALGPQPIVQAW